MRFLVALLVCLTLLPLALVAAGRSSSAAPAKRIVNGREYQDLAGYARKNGLTYTWDGKSRNVRASSKAVRLAFSINQRDVEINSVAVWLSFPVILVQGRVVISTLDIRSTLEPLLSPPRNAARKKIKVIALDPGHGGRQPGNQDGNQLEKTHTLRLAQKVSSLLRASGLQVVMTRDEDETVELDARVRLAARQKADILVSLHYNGIDSDAGSASGVEVYCLTPAGAESTNTRGESSISSKSWLGNVNDARNLLLAYHVHKAIVGALPTNDRGIRRARFVVLRNASMPAILVEGGFMSDPEESKRIYSPSGRDKLARAVTDGILAYKRILER